MVAVRLNPWGEREKEKVLRSFQCRVSVGQDHHGEESPEEKKITLKTSEANFLILLSLEPIQLLVNGEGSYVP